MSGEVSQMGTCTHPAIQKRSDGWYCTECQTKVG